MATELAPIKEKSQHRIRQEGYEPNRNQTVCPIETPSQETKVMRHEGNDRMKAKELNVKTKMRKSCSPLTKGGWGEMNMKLKR